jgi:hypothetical protein
MNNVKHRYSAEIQRTKGLLELAAALYDTSLLSNDAGSRASYSDRIARRVFTYARAHGYARTRYFFLVCGGWISRASGGQPGQALGCLDQSFRCRNHGIQG